MTTAEIIALSDRYLCTTYARAPLALVRGDGARVWDADGREYLDFFSSTVVTVLGHAHPRVTAAICEQAGRILQVSNLHYSEPQARLAEALVTHSFADRAFLCNSGAEANEAAIKLARKFGHERGGGRFEVITTLGSFHGRSLATIAATGQEKVRVGFEPVPRGFRYAAYGDLAAVEAALTPQTIAVMVEPVQGEGGIIVPPDPYLRGLRELCDTHGLLLVFDEVQTGMGRTGPLFAHQTSGVTPDIMTLAKGLGGGVPIGAMLATERVAASFTPGAHGSTFGGNALASAAALAVLETLLEPGFLEDVQGRATGLRTAVEEVAARHETAGTVRGRGMLLGIPLHGRPAAEVVDAARERGLIVNATGDNVLRLAPPLVVSHDQIDRAVAVVDEALAR